MKATAAWDRHPDKAKCPKCGGKHRKKDCVKTSLGKQVKELISERAHLGDTYNPNPQVLPRNSDHCCNSDH